MDKVKIDLKAPKNSIAALRKVSNEPAICRKCYYYINKRKKEIKKYNREIPEENECEIKKEKRDDVVVLKDYCCCYHKTGEEARQICNGRWIYDHE